MSIVCAVVSWLCGMALSGLDQSTRTETHALDQIRYTLVRVVIAVNVVLAYILHTKFKISYEIKTYVQFAGTVFIITIIEYYIVSYAYVNLIFNQNVWAL